MSRRNILFLTLAVVAAVVCVRLGFWQLSRLGERRARNALVAARLVAAPIPLAALPSDTSALRFRRVRLVGRYDYAHEVALTNRTRNGSPGVFIVTPLRLPGSDAAVLVNRGWVYSPDGASVDLAQWREGDRAAVTGYVEPFPPPRPGAIQPPDRPSALRWLSRAEMARRTPYPIAPFYVIQLGDSAGQVLQLGDSAGQVMRSGDSAGRPEGIPARLAPPPLDEGSHLSYAVQWFSFGAIALIGPWFFLRAERRRKLGGPAPHDPS
jgi:surfeit locus 1 family protein